MGKPDAIVPCGSCTICCKGEAIILHPEDGDDPRDYPGAIQVIRHPLLAGQNALALMQRADGSCTYLGPFGCSIHAKRPAICRGFDCRKVVEHWNKNRAQMKAAGIRADDPVMVRGRELLGKA